MVFSEDVHKFTDTNLLSEPGDIYDIYYLKNKIYFLRNNSLFYTGTQYSTSSNINLSSTVHCEICFGGINNQQIEILEFKPID